MQESKELLQLVGELNGECQKTIQGSKRIVWLIILILNGLSLITYSILSYFLEWKIDIVIMLVLAVIVTLSIKKIKTLYTQIKDAEKLGIVNYYKLFEDYLTVESKQNGKKIGKGKAMYADLYKVVKKGNYIYLYNKSKNCYPIRINELNENETAILNQIISKIGKK